MEPLFVFIQHCPNKFGMSYKHKKGVDKIDALRAYSPFAEGEGFEPPDP